MAHENVELAMSLIEAVAQRDLARLIELTDPEVEWHSFIAELGEGGVYRGHDGVRRYVNDLNETLEVLRLHPDDALAVGQVVVLVGQLETRGRDSGVETTVASGYMAKFREGKVVQMRAFREPEAAFQAVGLSAG